MKRGTDINLLLKPLSQQKTQAFLNNEVQAADVIEWIAGQMGACSLIQSSFSISEEFVRRLYFLLQKSNIKEITLVLDHKAMKKAVKLWPFLCQVVKKTYIANNHSKCLVFHSDDGRKAAVITSQNLTRGNRYESTIITTDQAVVDTINDALEFIINNKAAPLNELINATLRDD